MNHPDRGARIIRARNNSGERQRVEINRRKQQGALEVQSAVVEYSASPRPVLAAKVDQAAASVVRDRAHRVEALEDEPGRRS